MKLKPLTVVALLSGVIVPVLQCMTAATAPPATDGGAHLVVSQQYVAAVNAALSDKRDIWGEQALSQPEGPTFENVKDYLVPIMHGDPGLTDSGTYYIPFGQPTDPPNASLENALHVADGSQFFSNSPENYAYSEQYGNTWNIYVGVNGDELFGSSLARLKMSQLADGYPILQTEYVDAEGIRYLQESFAARASEIPDAGGYGNLVSWIRVTVDPGMSTATQPLVNFVPSQHQAGHPPKERLPRLLEATANRLIGAEPQPNTTYLLFSPGAKYPVPTNNLFSPALQYSIDLGSGQPTTAYVVRLNQPGQAVEMPVDSASYEKARASVIEYWNKRLAQGATFEVPENEVMKAQRALLIQNINMGKWYSIGNFYQTSYTEQYNALKTLGEYGFADMERRLNEELMDFTQNGRKGFDTLFMGIKMWAAANYYKRTLDKQFIDKFTPTFEQWCQTFTDQIAADPNGLLQKENWAGDIGSASYALSYNQGYGFAGMSDMVQVWSMTGHEDLVRRFAPVVAQFDKNLQKAIERSETKLADGSLFIPARLLEDTEPYDPITATTEGSYWNLVITHPLGVGIVEPNSERAKGVLQYMSNHGAHMLGLVRFSLLPLGSHDPNAGYGMQSPGIDAPYNYDLAEFLADNQQSDQLVLGVYGLLAHAVTRGTYVGGEGNTVAPVAGQYYRQMCRPPNSVTTAAILNYLRLMLVHETEDAQGRSNGLELAHSVPRTWLSMGKRIAVTSAPTDFGLVSYSLERVAENAFNATIDVPPRLTSNDRLTLRIRLPTGRIDRVLLNDQPHNSYDASTGIIDLSGYSDRLIVRVEVTP